MILDMKKKICFLANTKTASTAIERNIKLTPSQIRFACSPYKHMNLNTFMRLCRLFNIEHESIITVCIIRHPYDKAKSWFKYRNRDNMPTHLAQQRSLKGMSFEDYISIHINMIKEERKLKDFSYDDFDDRSFVTSKNGDKVKKIFKYNDITSAFKYLGENFTLNKKSFPEINQSPNIDTSADKCIKDEFFNTYHDCISWYEDNTFQ